MIVGIVEVDEIIYPVVEVGGVGVDSGQCGTAAASAPRRYPAEFIAATHQGTAPVPLQQQHKNAEQERLVKNGGS